VADAASAWVPADEGPFDYKVSADPEELRQRYERELREDGMYDAPDDKLIRHVYDNNPDAPELTVEEAW
jgi:hypothetical protein